MSNSNTNENQPKGAYYAKVFFEVEDANLNGDPDNNGDPRTITSHKDGLEHAYVTDVCLKHKIRNELKITHGDDLYILPEDNYSSLRDKFEETTGVKFGENKVKFDDGEETTIAESNEEDSAEYEVNASASRKPKKKKVEKDNFKSLEDNIKAMLDRYIDIRLFGGVYAFRGCGDMGNTKGAITFTNLISDNSVEITDHAKSKCILGSPVEKKGDRSDNLGISQVRINYATFSVFLGAEERNLIENHVSELDLAKLTHALRFPFRHDAAQNRPITSLRVKKVVVVRGHNINSYSLFKDIVGKYTDDGNLEIIFDSNKLEDSKPILSEKVYNGKGEVTVYRGNGDESVKVVGFIPEEYGL